MKESILINLISIFIYITLLHKNGFLFKTELPQCFSRIRSSFSKMSSQPLPQMKLNYKLFQEHKKKSFVFEQSLSP